MSDDSSHVKWVYLTHWRDYYFEIKSFERIKYFSYFSLLFGDGMESLRELSKLE